MENSILETKEGPPQRRTLDSLSHDELLQKCKGLLGIAQKAKQSKDEIINENHKLKEKLASYESGKLQDDIEELSNQNKSLQLLVEELTTKDQNLLMAVATSNENFKICQISINRLQQENQTCYETIDRERKLMESKIADMTDALEEKAARHKSTLMELTDTKSKCDALQLAAISNEEKYIAMEEKVKSLEEQISSLQLNVSSESTPIAYEREAELLRAFSELEVKYCDIFESNNKFKSRINELEKDLNLKNNTDNVIVLNKNNQLLQKDDIDSVECTKLRETISELEGKNSEMLKENTNLKRELVDNKEENNKSSCKCNQITENLSEPENTRLATLQTNDGMTTEALATDVKVKNLEQEIENLNLKNVKECSDDKNSDLVQELKGLNTDLETKLKASDEEIERLQKGMEVISNENANLKKSVIDYEYKIKCNLEQIFDLNTFKEQHEYENTNLQEALSKSVNSYEKCKIENCELLSEMRELNEVIKNRGDAISKQSTRTDELQKRFEELTAAHKDCENVLQQTNEIVTMKEAKIRQITDELIAQKVKASNTLETQSEMSMSTMSKIEEASRLRDFDDTGEEKYNKLRALAVKLKRKVSEQMIVIEKLEDSEKIRNAENTKLKMQLEETKNINSQPQQQEQQVLNSNKQKQSQDWKNENDALIIMKRNFENDIKRLKDENVKLALQFELQSTNIETLKKQLAKAKLAANQNNVLSLELKVYEDNLADRTRKLSDKTAEVKMLESTIDTHNNTISGMASEIKMIEENLQAEKQHSLELKHQIDRKHEHLKDSEVERVRMQSELNDLTQELKTIQEQQNILRSELQTSNMEKEQQCSIIEFENQKLLQSLRKTESDLIAARDKITAISKELDELRSEFANYKIRVTSVLRQTQTKETTREKDLEDELRVLQSERTTLINNIQGATTTIKQLQESNDELIIEKVRSSSRCKELLNALDESRSQINTATEQALTYQETIKMHKLQIDNISDCFRDQIDMLKQTHADVVKKLKDQVKQNTENEKSLMQDSVVLHKTQTVPLEREDAEGCENTATTKHRKISSSRSRHELMPLDELLTASFDDNNEVYPSSPNTELALANDNLNIQKARNKHLSTLLAEAEQDLVRLTQLNDVLKEEVRRQQRSLERDQHLHNTEYLKNIILMFVTLNNVDEKMRLVPVLTTILKLSPEETLKLNNVAKGGDSGPSRNWGLFWPGNSQ